ncbi:MAG: hypothetical protein IPP94_15400 [Ignavibacteria bacterium]|nr:hypothetical protein [Ignavibacteria bacterium]
MGFQQTLYIAVSLIIVGISVFVAIGFAGEQQDSAVRDAVTQDCLRLAAEARIYYKKPAFMGGGQGSFDGVTLQDMGFTSESNENGTYVVKADGDECVIIGTALDVPGSTVSVSVDANGGIQMEYSGWGAETK